MRAIGVIPARYAAARLPGKPLADIAGRPMIEHVYRRASQASSLAEVWVATDDERIYQVVRGFGGNVMMTDPNHPSGTDRIAEAARDLHAEVVVNVQGDEPLLSPAGIDAVVAPFAERADLQMCTLATPLLEEADVRDPAVVKVVLDQRGDALYFSRLPVPYYRGGERGSYLKHIGLYAYRKEFVQHYARMAPTPLEQAERLEQLRVLENGFRIHVVVVRDDAISVDTPEDLERVRRLVTEMHSGA